MNRLKDHYHNYLEAIRAGDAQSAAQLIATARAAGASPQELYVEIMEPSLVEIGLLWQRRECSVAEEHRATRITETLLAGMDKPKMPPNGLRYLVASIYPNQHHVGPRILTILLEQAGWTVRNIGASVLLAELKHHARVFKPHIIGLSLALETQAPAAAIAIQTLKGRWTDIPIMVGGPAVKLNARLGQQVGADGSAQNAAEALPLAKALLAV